MSEPMSDEPAVPYVLSEKGLEEIRRRVTGTCSCCGENVHEFDVPDVLELLDDVDRLRAGRDGTERQVREQVAADLAHIPIVQHLGIVGCDPFVKQVADRALHYAATVVLKGGGDDV
jgi:hypothetical protein